MNNEKPRAKVEKSICANVKICSGSVKIDVIDETTYKGETALSTAVTSLQREISRLKARFALNLLSGGAGAAGSILSIKLGEPSEALAWCLVVLGALSNGDNIVKNRRRVEKSLIALFRAIDTSPDLQK
jgi:hypothetical protein